MPLRDLHKGAADVFHARAEIFAPMSGNEDAFPRSQRIAGALNLLCQ